MDFFDQVVEFNQEILGIKQRSPAPLCEKERFMTMKCLHEELAEFGQASEEQHLAGEVDSVVDLICFAIGALYKMGLTAEQIRRCCSAVHAANMAKKRGVNAKRDHGVADAVKPKDWTPPETTLAQIIYEQ